MLWFSVSATGQLPKYFYSSDSSYSVRFESVVLENKMVEQFTQVNFIFHFTNTGKKAISVQSVMSSCGCLSPHWSKDSVLPGKSAEVKGIFNASNPGIFTKTLLLQYQAGIEPIILTIKGLVHEVPLSFAFNGYTNNRIAMLEKKDTIWVSYLLMKNLLRTPVIKVDSTQFELIHRFKNTRLGKDSFGIVIKHHAKGKHNIQVRVESEYVTDETTNKTKTAVQTISFSVLVLQKGEPYIDNRRLLSVVRQNDTLTLKIELTNIGYGPLRPVACQMAEEKGLPYAIYYTIFSARSVVGPGEKLQATVVLTGELSKKKGIFLVLKPTDAVWKDIFLYWN